MVPYHCVRRWAKHLEENASSCMVNASFRGTRIVPHGGGSAADRKRTLPQRILPYAINVVLQRGLRRRTYIPIALKNNRSELSERL